ncbi:unnamed protein product [Polarella glacialis]|uniref:EF-hand domain-containing protein n=1 Tax=Polarella glacialis TaxID=89957 RepID=A0A813GZX1_POLGL|nr:unnamed protein product [Polarella glacialis]
MQFASQAPPAGWLETRTGEGRVEPPEILPDLIRVAAPGSPTQSIHSQSGDLQVTHRSQSGNHQVTHRSQSGNLQVTGQEQDLEDLPNVPACKEGGTQQKCEQVGGNTREKPIAAAVPVSKGDKMKPAQLAVLVASSPADSHSQELGSHSSPAEQGTISEGLASILEDKRKSMIAVAERDANVQAELKQAAGQSSKARGLERIMHFDARTLTGLRKILYPAVSHWSFDSFIGLVIVLNGVMIGIETANKVHLPPGCDANCVCSDPLVACTSLPGYLEVFGFIFFVIYFVEISLRLYVWGPYALINNWIKFDLFLVSLTAADIFMNLIKVDNAATKQLMLVRMLRLARLARVIRLTVMFQTLWKLVQGLLHSVKILCWTFLLFMILAYVFAIAGMEFCTTDSKFDKDHIYNFTAKEYFGGIVDAILTIIELFTFDSIGGIYRPMINGKVLLFFYFIGVQLLMSIALMNLVTAIMVNAALNQANSDKETQKEVAKEKKKQQIVELKELFVELDKGGDGEPGDGNLTLEEINDAPAEIMEKLIEISGTDDIQGLFNMLDYDGGGTVAADEFCEGVMKATNSDELRCLS